MSDLHMGVGFNNGNAWDPTEDFRWSQELRGFLRKISDYGHDGVDLVIAGDLLELWQPPAALICSIDRSSSSITRANSEAGCTLDEIREIARMVIEAHKKDLEELGAFADRGSNRLYLLPGNHDAAIREPGIWKLLEEALAVQDKNKLFLRQDGVWYSDDGVIVVEHGHQIAPDANRFDDWPNIVRGGSLVRPWGELFVQRIYSEREKEYPIIDNIIPESAGIHYYSVDRGVIGSIKDFARFLAFNAFQASLRQVGAFLGDATKGREQPEWDLEFARKELGHRLFTDSFAQDDPLRNALLYGGKDDEWGKLREHLDDMARDEKELSRNQVGMLCDQIAIRKEEFQNLKNVSESKEGSKSHDLEEPRLCQKPTAGDRIRAYFLPRAWVMRPHLNERLSRFPEMRLFVYGHTHLAENPWMLDGLLFGREVMVVNTGAFQRLIDQETLVAKAKLYSMRPYEALKRLELDKDLPSCYSAVVIDYDDSGEPRAKLRFWHVDQNGHGDIIESYDSHCAQLVAR